MFRTIATKTLRDRGRSLAGWSIGIIALTTLLSALWPTIRDLEDFQALLDSYPEELGRLFGIESLLTPAGYLNTEYFSLLGPILFLTFGIGLGARLPAAEEERGALDVLLSLPVPRWRLLLEHAVALLLALVVLGVAQVVGVMLGSAAFGMGVPLGAAVSASASLVLLGALFGLVALAVGAGTGRRVVALAASSVLAVAAYVLYVAAQLVSAVEPWAVLSPFEHTVGAEPILNGNPAGASSVLAAVALAAVVAAVAVFTRRDLAAA